jgi:RND superfamily putative drug exporter
MRRSLSVKGAISTLGGTGRSRPIAIPRLGYSKAVRGDPAAAGVGGSGPETVDFNNAVYDRFPLLLILLSALTFVVLLRAFRSPLLALKAVVLNLVTLAAAYGVLVFVWQDGHGSNLVFGLPATGAVVNWVPIVVFAFLFGWRSTTKCSSSPACARPGTSATTRRPRSSKASAEPADW